jgi:hypothetical protein
MLYILCHAAKLIVPEWGGGDTVKSVIGLSYQPASLCSLAGRYDNPMPESPLSPLSGTMNFATGSRNNQHSAKPDKIVVCKNQKTPEAIPNQNPEMCIFQESLSIFFTS